ncbi:MAG: hypothetical protein GQ559_02150 [Desulfobulbaceae bacterium]|nr:hypothetical protein [Desulfobulbaceae bacterium]
MVHVVAACGEASLKESKNLLNQCSTLPHYYAIITEKLKAPRSVLKERGLLYGQPQLRCLPIIRTILSRVQDRSGIPLELHRFLETSRISFRGNLPLEEETGVKLALMFKLQERIKELDRVELLARRIDRFTREEASYWYSRITSFGPVANRWAAGRYEGDAGRAQ